MTKHNCTTCTHSEWKLLKNGNRQLSAPGKCICPVIPLPHCFIITQCRENFTLPRRKAISKHTPENCPRWEKIIKRNTQ